MAYKRRYAKRKRRRTRYRGRRQGKSAAFRMAKAALKRVRPEWKALDDTIITGASVTTAGTVYTLTPLIAQGLDSDDRIGQKITLRRIQMRATLSFSGDQTALNQRVRLLVFGFKDSDEPTVGGIMASASTLGYLDIATSGKYHMIYDKIFTLGKYGNLRSQYLIKKSFKFNRQLLYPTDTASQANNWRLCAIVIASSATFPATVSIVYRTRYTDM